MVVQPGRKSLSAIVLVDQASGKRSIMVGKTTCDDLAPEEINAGAVEEAKVLHLDGTIGTDAAAVVAAERARAAGVTVVLDADNCSIDPDARPGRDCKRAHLRRLIALSDVVIASESFAEKYSTSLRLAVDPAAAVGLLRGAGPTTVLVTLGEKGGVGEAEGRAFRYSAYSVEVVDTTGAGDVFHGAYIHGMLAGWGLERRVQFASAVAAMKCRKLGGRTGIPTVEEAEAFIVERGGEFVIAFD